jgi:hypothetical protein
VIVEVKPMVKASEMVKTEQSTKRQGINFGKLNLIPADEVPQPSRASTPYKELLRQIAKGQALYLTEREVSLATAAAAVRKLQKLQEFKDFTITQRTVEGQKRLYIIHEDNKPEKKSEGKE